MLVWIGVFVCLTSILNILDINNEYYQFWWQFSDNKKRSMHLSRKQYLSHAMINFLNKNYFSTDWTTSACHHWQMDWNLKQTLFRSLLCWRRHQTLIQIKVYLKFHWYHFLQLGICKPDIFFFLLLLWQFEDECCEWLQNCLKRWMPCCE